MGADGNHDVPEVNGCDFSSIGIVSLHKGLLRVLQLYFLQLEKVKRISYVSYFLSANDCSFVQQTTETSLHLDLTGPTGCSNAPLNYCFF